MPQNLIARARRDTVPLAVIAGESLDDWLGGQPAIIANWLRRVGFAARAGEAMLVPDATGKAALAVAGAGDDGPWPFAALAATLPAGSYRLADPIEPAAATRAALGWRLGAYRFGRYRTQEPPRAQLVWPRAADRAAVQRAADAVFLVRDLINTPAADMGPAELATAARRVARVHGARVHVVVGDDLLRRNFPAIHAVGRASARAPRLINLSWGDAGAPKVTLVGKGICFDTGGLDLKTAAGMKLMKKDMGGGATVLGLAAMIMGANLPVRLRVLVPAAENSVSATAMRPGDVLRTRKGVTVEVGNTDAEGRLVLCDALAEADREKPAMIVDCATLTGAARVALGPELPALFSNDDALATDLLRHAEAESDPMWRLPLWRPYRMGLESQIADLNNVSDGPFGGAITAALFLESFVSADTPWVHLDLFAWNSRGRPGRPEGGEAQAIRALFSLLAERFAGKVAAPRR